MSCSNLPMHHTISSAGGSTLADLQQALEDYLPVLLGLVKDGKTCVRPFALDACSLYNMSWLIAYLYHLGSHLQYKVQFVWVNQEDDAEVIPSLNINFYTQEYLSFFPSLFPFFRGVIDTFYRKQLCLMLGMRCCQFCTWWQCYPCHRLIYYFFQECPLMVISQKYQKVSNTENNFGTCQHIPCYLPLILLLINPNNQNTFDRLV